MKITNKILMLALGALAFACEDPEYPTPVPSTTQVRGAYVAGFNFWANSQNLDFLYDNATAGQTNLALGANSGSSSLYSAVATGLHNVGFDTTSKRTSAKMVQSTFLKSKYYSVFATDLSNSPLVITESFPAAVDGKAQVRFLQLSATADTAEVVDTATTASVILSKMPFRSTTTSFKAVDAGQVNWRIRQNTKKTTTKYSPINVVETFSAGKNYTVVLRGSVTGSGSLGLGYTVIQHN